MPSRPDAKSRVLLAEADTAFGGTLRGALARAGLSCGWVRHFGDIAPALARQPHDGLVLSAELPGIDGDRLPAAVQHFSRTLVTVVVAAAPAPADTIRLLELGADEHLPRPADPRELAARVQALLRRSRRAQAAALELEHGALRLQLQTRSATWRGQPVALTGTEYRLLEALVRRRREVLPRSTLEALVRDGYAASNTLEVHVHNLRRKFGRHIVRTVRGVGYQAGSGDAEPW